MAILSKTPLKNPQEDGDTLLAGRWPMLIKTAASLIILLIVLSLLRLSSSSREESKINLENSRTVISSSGYGWTEELITSFDEKHLWLKHHGVLLETIIFEKLGTAIFSSAGILHFNREEAGMLPASFISLHFIFLRIGFTFLCAWRLWLFAAIIGFLSSSRKIRSHTGLDILGETGQGKLYDSDLTFNIKDFKLENLSKIQLTGLACPNSVPAEIVRKSDLFLLLQNFRAHNETNQDLIGIILYYNDLPGYVADREDTRTSDKTLTLLNLPEYTEKWLRAALDLQVLWQSDASGNTTDAQRERQSLSHIEVDKGLEQIIKSALSRILTEDLKEEIAKMNPELIATLILSYFSAKPLVYTLAGKRWISRVRFPELSARAILHSLPAFIKDYCPSDRKSLRRSLVYASRKSEFSRAPFPREIEPQTKALRNWSELMLATPSQLKVSADSIEIFSLFEKIHRIWVDSLCSFLSGKNERLSGSIYAPAAGLFLMPVATLVKICADQIGPRDIGRLEELADLLKQEKMLEPISFLDLKELVRAHEVSEDILRLWSIYRIVLQRYGWLPGQIAECRVPLSFLIFTYCAESKMEGFSKDLTGYKGMVGIRISRMNYYLESAWGNSFVELQLKNIFSSREQFDQVLHSNNILKGQATNK